MVSAEISPDPVDATTPPASPTETEEPSQLPERKTSFISKATGKLLVRQDSKSATIHVASTNKTARVSAETVHKAIEAEQAIHEEDGEASEQLAAPHENGVADADDDDEEGGTDRYSQTRSLLKKFLKGVGTRNLLRYTNDAKLKDYVVRAMAISEFVGKGPVQTKNPPRIGLAIQKDIWRAHKALDNTTQTTDELKNEFLELVAKVINHIENDKTLSPTLVPHAATVAEIKRLAAVPASRMSRPEPPGAISPAAVIEPGDLPSVEDPKACIGHFANMQQRVTESYYSVIDAFKLRLRQSQGSPAEHKAAVTKVTREELLEVQRTIMNYQNALLTYQSEVNSLWEMMLSEQQQAEHDITWDHFLHGEFGTAAEEKKSQSQKKRGKFKRMFSRNKNTTARKSRAETQNSLDL